MGPEDFSIEDKLDPSLENNTLLMNMMRMFAKEINIVEMFRAFE